MRSVMENIPMLTPGFMSSGTKYFWFPGTHAGTPSVQKSLSLALWLTQHVWCVCAIHITLLCNIIKCLKYIFWASLLFVHLEYLHHISLNHNLHSPLYPQNCKQRDIFPISLGGIHEWVLFKYPISQMPRPRDPIKRKKYLLLTAQP